MSGRNTRQLYSLIKQYNLDATEDEYRDVVFRIEQGLMTEDVAQALLIWIWPHIERAKDHPNYLHRPPTAAELNADGPPDIECGHLVYARDVRIGVHYQRGPKSILVAGNQKSGKTTLIQGVVRGIDANSKRNPEKGASQFLFDQKGDFRHLADELGSSWQRVNVFDAGMHVAISNPEGTVANNWINTVSTSFCAYGGMVAAWTPLANVMRFLVAALNPHAIEPLLWPSLHLILEVLLASPPTLWSSKTDYYFTLIGVLEAATKASHIFDCFRGLDLDRMVRERTNLVIEMPNMSPSWLRQFMIDILIRQLLAGRMERHEKVDRTVAVVVMDEADQDATAECDGRFPEGMTALSTMLRRYREYGLMAVIGLAKLQRASSWVLSEPLYHCILNQSDAASISIAAHTLLLPRGAEVMLPALRPGQCLFRESQGPWPHPMLAQIDYVAPGRGPASRPLDTIPFIPAKPLRELPHVQEALQELIRQHRASHLRHQKPDRKEPALSRHAQTLLHAAAVYPYYPVARLYEKASLTLTPQTQMNIRKELEDSKRADFQEIRVSSVNVLLIRLTDITTKGQGRGSIAHQHISHWVKEIGIRRGFAAHTEWIVPGNTNHPVDVVWLTPDGKTRAWEVVVDCEDNLPAHIKACFEDSQAIDSLTIVVTQKAIRARLQKALGAEFSDAPYRDRIHYEIVESIMKELFES